MSERETLFARLVPWYFRCGVLIESPPEGQTRLQRLYVITGWRWTSRLLQRGIGT